MSLTQKQIQENTRAAANLIKQQLGLSERPVEWTYEQRTQYNKTLAQYISDHPSSFSPSQLTTAVAVKSTEYFPLVDTSFSWTEFTNEIGNQAASINDAVNPFSEKNRRLIFFLALGLGIIVVLSQTGALREGANAIKTVKG